MRGRGWLFNTLSECKASRRILRCLMEGVELLCVCKPTHMKVDVSSLAEDVAASSLSVEERLFNM